MLSCELAWDEADVSRSDVMAVCDVCVTSCSVGICWTRLKERVCDVVVIPKRGDATACGEAGLTECARDDDVTAPGADDVEVVDPERWNMASLNADGLGLACGALLFGGDVAELFSSSSLNMLFAKERPPVAAAGVLVGLSYRSSRIVSKSSYVFEPVVLSGRTLASAGALLSVEEVCRKSPAAGSEAGESREICGLGWSSGGRGGDIAGKSFFGVGIGDDFGAFPLVLFRSSRGTAYE